MHLGLGLTQAQAHRPYQCNVFAFVTLVICRKPCVETEYVRSTYGSKSGRGGDADLRTRELIDT